MSQRVANETAKLRCPLLLKYTVVAVPVPLPSGDTSQATNLHKFIIIMKYCQICKSVVESLVITVLQIYCRITEIRQKIHSLMQ